MRERRKLLEEKMKPIKHKVVLSQVEEIKVSKLNEKYLDHEK